MSCSQILNGIARDCTPSMGGLVEVLVANYADVTAVTETTDQISAISMADSATFKSYKVAKQSSNFVQTETIDLVNGVNYVQTDIALVFNRMETAKRIEMKALSLNELVVICKDANGKYWYFGKEEPVMASAGTGESGTARTDRNGYTITLQANEPTFAMEVTAEAIATILG